MNTPENSNPVSEFLQFYINKKTRDNYRNAIHKFLATIYPAVQPDVASLDKAGNTYLSEVRNLRNPALDVLNAGILFTKKYAPATVNLNLCLILTWLEDNNITLKKRERQRIFAQLPRVYSIRQEAELTREMFQNLYCELPEWTRVMLLVLLASGMRLGETLALEKRDIAWNGERTTISIRAETTKTKMPRTTYLTKEASDALKHYLTERKDDNPLIFPYYRESAQYYMRKAADKSGHGKKDGKPRDVHWHMTRKWFISRFSLYASKEVAEELAGHEGYLAKSYQRFTRNQILEQYAIAEQHLTLFPNQ